MITRGSTLLRSIVMIAIAIVACAIIFQFSGYSAVDAMSGFVEGAITGPGSLMSTLRWSLPLMLVGVGTVLCFRSGYFNVGAQGQLYMGAIAAAALIPVLPGPAPVRMAIGIVAAIAAGMLWSLISAWLKTSTGADELLTTLMLNFIGALVLQYVTNGPLRDLSGSGQVAAAPPLPLDVRITGSSGVGPVNVTLVVLVLIGCWFLVNRTTFGLSATIVGRNPQVAARQGVNPRAIVWSTFALSGGLAGLAGALEVLGPTGRLIQGFSPDVGFTGVLVALVGGLTVLGATFAALFFGALAAAIGYLPIVTDLPRSALEVLQGLVALLITVQLRARWKKRAAKTKPDPAPVVPEPSVSELASARTKDPR